MKYVTFSYDDGCRQDIRFTEILRKYNLKATFNLNSGFLGNRGRINHFGFDLPFDKIDPDEVKQVYEGFERIIAEKYPDADIIAGVATGAIAHGVLVAERMGKPFIYVRSSPKTHGLTNQVEGEYWPGAKVVVVEDLVSTGGSSLSAVEALREGGCDVLGMVAFFTYGFPTAEENFAGADVKLDTLSNYKTMIELAVNQGYVHEDELQTLKEWRRDPANWKK